MEFCKIYVKLSVILIQNSVSYQIKSVKIKYCNLAKLLYDNAKKWVHVPITKMDDVISTLLKYIVTIIKFAMGGYQEFAPNLIVT